MMCQLSALARELYSETCCHGYIHQKLLRCYRHCRCKTANAHASTVLESFLLDICALPKDHSMSRAHCHSTLTQVSLLGRSPHTIARMTLPIKRDGHWNSFQFADNMAPLSVTGTVIARSAIIDLFAGPVMCEHRLENTVCLT